MKYGAIIAVFASAVAARYMYVRPIQRLSYRLTYEAAMELNIHPLMVPTSNVLLITPQQRLLSRTMSMSL